MHVFDVCYTGMGIEHRLSPPCHPQTNGMVTRFNRSIIDRGEENSLRLIHRAGDDFDALFNVYNHLIQQRALNQLTPIQSLKKWYS
ncbi:MAG: integrase core domain-containing protein [Candidatus Nitrotoga sp.]